MLKVSEGSGEEADDLQMLLDARRRRPEEDAAMRERVAADVEARMDNGVRIDPRLGAWARRRTGGGCDEATGRATQGEAARPTQEVVTPRRRCPGGHEMVLASVGGAGLLCDGGCGRGIRRGGEWWSCEECDLDMCMACCREDEGGMAIDAIDAIDA